MGQFRLYCPGEDLIFPTSILYRLSVETERIFKASVVPYKSYVRYQYPNEPWQKVEGNDYSIEQDFDPNNNSFDWHYIEFDAEVASRYPPTLTQPAIHEAGDIIPVGLNASYPGITSSSINPVKVQPNYNCQFEYVSNFGGCRKRTVETVISSKHPLSSGKRCRTEEAGSTASNPAIKNISAPTLTEDTSRNPIVCNNYVNSCNFVISTCGYPVFQEEREVCPDAEKALCLLEEQKELKIGLNKHDTIIVIEGKVNILPPLISIFWANIGRSVRGLLFDPQILIDIAEEALGNPEECILILKIGDFNTIDSVFQYCSSCDCPHPFYQTECSALGCPDNTCEVDCGDHLCCYDSQGKAVLSIEK